jgi:tRNA pseudouridine32 synthase / 23S rRNA pseudouridine746 synthase
MFDLLTDDPRFLLVDKHPGVSFHRQGDEPGLVEVVRARCGEVWPVHRLDRMTSGLLLFARTPEVARALSQALAERRMRKLYLALSDRKPARKQGLLSGDMVKGRGGAWRLTPKSENPAVTRFLSTSLAPGLRLFFLRPLTGKTHQLRVALKSLGAPIVGDPLYHGATGAVADRGYLHAWSLSFELDGERFAFCRAPTRGALFLREDFRRLIAEPQWQPDALPWPDQPAGAP